MTFKKAQSTYKGGWKGNKRSGHGVQTDREGSFEGEFLNDKMHGYGVMTFTDGL